MSLVSCAMLLCVSHSMEELEFVYWQYYTRIIDEVISAEMPDIDIDPGLLEVVTKTWYMGYVER